MTKDELINFLSNDLKKVKILERPVLRLLTWVFINITFLVLFIGIQIILKDSSLFPINYFFMLVPGLLFLSSSWVIFKRNIPRKNNSSDLLLPNILILLWIGNITFQLFSGNEGELSEILQKHTSYLDFVCLTRISIMSLFSGLFLYYEIKKGYFHTEFYSIIFITLVPFVVGEWGIYFLCPDHSAGHFIIWHFLIVIPVFILGYTVNRYFLRRL